MLKRSLCWIVLILCLSAPSLGFAFGREARAGGRWWRLPMVSERLNLTDEHKSKLDRLFIENRRNLIELRSKLETEQLNLAELLDQEPFDESALMAQYRKLESARSQLAAERFQYLLEVRKILGAERFRRLEAIYGTFRDRLRRGLSGDEKEPAP